MVSTFMLNLLWEKKKKEIQIYKKGDKKQGSNSAVLLAQDYGSADIQNNSKQRV